MNEPEEIGREAFIENGFDDSAKGQVGAAARWHGSWLRCFDDLSEFLEYVKTRIFVKAVDDPNVRFDASVRSEKGTPEHLLRTSTFVKEVAMLCLNGDEVPDWIRPVLEASLAIEAAIGEQTAIPHTKARPDFSDGLGKAYVEFREAVREARPRYLKQLLSQRGTSPKLADAEAAGCEETKAADVSPADRVRDQLNRQSLKIFNYLVEGPQHYVSFDSLKLDCHCWRGRPDPEDVNDDTVFEALKRLRGKLSSLEGCPFELQIERSASRVRLLRPNSP